MPHISLTMTYRDLPNMFYSECKPAVVLNPVFLMKNENLLVQLGLPSSILSDVDFLLGAQLPQHSTTIAQAYAGHQFGHFTMLGDGRAILLGEVITNHQKRFDLHLKGSGRTPYSRGGDGKAAIGPMLREYIISEAMHALGIPTTRSLAVIATGEQIVRQTPLPGAILVRVADSHIRVGTFEYAYAYGTMEDVRALADYAIHRHYPDAMTQVNPYLHFFKQVIHNQATLIAKWMLVGFIHGVMNTDNMTISGETIDYGPCAFMNQYDPATVFSSIDKHSRYAYQNQPGIGQCNLMQLGLTLLPLIDEDEDKAIAHVQALLHEFKEVYEATYFAGMRAKIGLVQVKDVDDTKLIDELLALMHQHKVDYTYCFRALSDDCLQGDAFFSDSDMITWLRKWEKRKEMQSLTKHASVKLMKQSNPRIIPRNHKVEEALAAAEKNDFQLVHHLLDAVSHPFEDAGFDEYAAVPPDSDQPYRTFCGT